MTSDSGITDRSRTRTMDWLSTLEARYGSLERVDKHWKLPPESYERTRRRVADGTNGGAGVWITDDDGSVLLVRNEGDDGWSDPGGKREDDESFEETARREVREETGVECRITGLLEAHVLTIDDDTEPSRPTLSSLIVVFDGEYVSGPPRPREGEIADVGWFDRPPERVLYPEVAQRPFPAGD